MRSRKLRIAKETKTKEKTMQSENTKSEIVPTSEAQVLPGFTTSQGFDLIQRQAKVFASSDLVPDQFRGNMANCIIALEMANRMGANPMAVLQNLYIVHGKPGWSSTFIIATVNSGGRFSPMRFEFQSEKGKQDWGCRAYATERGSEEKLMGPWVTWDMAEKEGWTKKNGSKWQTMPELMFRYRAATFWARLFCPETLMGMRTADELEDITTEAKIAAAKPVKDAEALLGPKETLAPTPSKGEGKQSDKQPSASAEGKTTQTKTKEKGPSSITAREKLIVLIQEAGFNEPSFERFLISRGDLGQSESVRSISEAKAEEFVSGWNVVADEFVAKMEGGK